MATRKGLAAALSRARGSSLVGASAPAICAGELRLQQAVQLLEPEDARHASRQIVKQRMRSVGNISKITAAMKMVAASRLRGTQTKMEQSRGFPQPFIRLLGDSPALDTESTLIVPVTSDKGLCGGINSTVVKYTRVLDKLTVDAEGKPHCGLYVLGEKGRAQLVRGETVQKIRSVVVDSTKSKEGYSFASASLMAEGILKENAEKTQILYNRFVSAIAFKPTVATILSPAAVDQLAEELGGLPFDNYELEGPEDRGEMLLDLYEFQMAATLYNGILENSTSELGSRMQSMENSTKNAKEMLGRLTLFYNRTRQAAITTELIEIISGAAALEG